ncbi:RTA1 like protein [Xylogone sp. PMI_703]|nr:RTA1 like protein [Xylogone sp. PMI_703]
MADQSHPSDFKLFYYSPSLGAAIIFVILFFGTTLLHTYQLLRTKTLFFIPFLIGGYFESVGYIFRAITCNQTPNWEIGTYIAQFLLPLIAPALFAASIYMELGKIIVILHGEKYAIIRVKWLTKVFVTGDIISFLVQAAGGGIMGNKTTSGYTTGSHVVVTGLAIQLIFFGFFVISSAVFHSRILRTPTPRSLDKGIQWQTHIYALYMASTLILIRSVYRLIEFTQSNGSYLVSHEVYYYIFDALLMFTTMILFHVVHPSELNALLNSGGIISKGIKFRELHGNSDSTTLN